MTPAKRSPEEWKALIAEHAASGKSQQAFVQEKKLVLSSFQYWKRRLENSGDESSFVAVKTEGKRPEKTLRIEFTNGIKLEVSPLDGLEEIFRMLAGL